jgi:hypothetical protein
MKCNVKTFTAPSAIPQSTTVYGTLTTSVPPCNPDDPPVDPPTGSCDVIAYQVFHYKLSCDTYQWIISAFEAGCVDIDSQGTYNSWHQYDRARGHQSFFTGENINVWKSYGDWNVFFDLKVEQDIIDGYPLWVRNAINTHGLHTGRPMDGFLIKYVKGYLCTYGGIDENLQVPICYPTPLVQSGVMNTPLTDTSNPDSMAFSLIELGDFGYPVFTPLAISFTGRYPATYEQYTMGDPYDYQVYVLYNSDRYITGITALPQDPYVSIVLSDYSEHINTCGFYYATVFANVGADIQYSLNDYLFHENSNFNYTTENVIGDTEWTYIEEGSPHYTATQQTVDVASDPWVDITNQTFILRKLYKRKFKIPQALINYLISNTNAYNNTIFVDDFFNLLIGSRKPPTLANTMKTTITATWDGGPSYITVNGITGALRNGIPKMSSMSYGCSSIRRHVPNGNEVTNETTIAGQRMFKQQFAKGDECHEGFLVGLTCTFTQTHKFTGAPLLPLATKSVIHNWRNGAVFLNNYGYPRSCGGKIFDPGRQVTLNAYGHHQRKFYNCFNGQTEVNTVDHTYGCLDEGYPYRWYTSCILGFGQIDREIGKYALAVPNDVSPMPKTYSMTFIHQGVPVHFTVTFSGFHSDDCFMPAP